MGEWLSGQGCVRAFTCSLLHYMLILRCQDSSEWQMLHGQTTHDHLKTCNCTLSCGVQEAKVQLLLMVEVLRDLDMDHKGVHTAAADMAYLYAMTQVWFTVERNYKVRLLIQCILMMHQVNSITAACQG